MKEGT